MTYNVAGCIARQSRFDAQRIFAIIDQGDADVVALQEVYNPIEGGEFLSQLGAMGYETMHFGPAVRNDEGHYGNALMIREGACLVDELDLSVDGREPRSAIRARFSKEGSDLEVITTHLGLSPRERTRQIDQLSAWISESDDEEKHRIILGDLNEWWPFSNREKKICHALGEGERVRTFPSWLPILGLDRILVSGIDLSQCRWWRMGGFGAKAASDHLPLLMEWELGRSS